jgi:hypothetical protein
MILSEIDRWRVAQLLIKQHGQDAELNAALRADEAIAVGDPKGESLWRDVMIKICQLQRSKLPQELSN